MTYDFPWGVQVGAGAQYVSDMTVSNSNTHHLQGFVLFDAMASYRLTENVDVRLNVYNITDEFYIEEAHGGGGHGVPGAGRSAVLRTYFRFGYGNLIRNWAAARAEKHTPETQSLMRKSYA